jgi:hypothetical protein
MKLTKANRKRAWPGLLILLVLGFPQISHAQTAGEQILAETNRLGRVLSSLKLSDEDRKLRADALGSVRQNLQSGNLYLSLYRLQPFWVEIGAQAYAASRAEVEAKGTEAFEKEWQRLGLELNEKQERLARISTGGSPAAVVALSESALTQVRPYYQSGRLYGLNTTIASGLYYMGLAPANLDFAIFCRGLRLTQNGKPLKYGALKPELARLEAEILESFRRMESSDNQPQFNRLNSTLKMALELDREGRGAGALLKYLEATLFLHLLTTPQADANLLPGLIEQSRLMESRLKKAGAGGGGGDHSIGLIYFEMAQSALDEAARGRPDKDRFKRAVVIMDRVLPRYFEIMSGDK